MALLPAEPRKRGILFAAIVAIMGVYVFQSYWYSDRAIELTELQDRLSFLESTNRVAEVTIVQGADLEERLAVYERHVATLERLIPQREEVPSLLNQINAEADAAGVVLRVFNPDDEIDASTEFYDRLSYDIEVVGEYHDVGRFLTAVAALPRIMTATGMSMNLLQGENATHPAIQGMVSPVEASFQVQTFVLREAPPVQLGQAEAGGGE